MMYACPELREKGRLAEVNEFAGSFSVNPHKNGLVGFDCTGTWSVPRPASSHFRIADWLPSSFPVHFPQGKGSDLPHQRPLSHAGGASGIITGCLHFSSSPVTSTLTSLSHGRLLEQYLKTKHGDTGAVIDYRNWNLSLGRRFRCGLGSRPPAAEPPSN
jgi:hypothetical protein